MLRRVVCNQMHSGHEAPKSAPWRATWSPSAHGSAQLLAMFFSEALAASSAAWRAASCSAASAARVLEALLAPGLGMLAKGYKGHGAMLFS